MGLGVASMFVWPPEVCGECGVCLVWSLVEARVSAAGEDWMCPRCEAPIPGPCLFEGESHER